MSMLAIGAYWPTKIQRLHPHGIILASNLYLTTLRMFYMMAVDDVLPFSDLLSDNLLHFRDDESSSSTASLTISVPPPPLKLTGALDDYKIKLFPKGQHNSNTEESPERHL